MHCSQMNVAEKILSQGNDTAVALICGAEAMTYATLRDQVTRTAAELLSRGYAKGDRIGLCSENSPFFVVAYLGVVRAGLVVVPFQTDLTEDTFVKIVLEAGIKEVLASKFQARRVHAWAAKAGVPVQTEAFSERSSAKAAIHWPAINSATDLAALMFTSGSTGTPKGVMVSHQNIDSNTQDIIAYMGLTATDRAMVVLPFHYCFGASLLHTHLMAGASLVLNNNFRLFPETVLQEMQSKECTGLAGVPSTYQILLRKSRFRQLTFPRLRWFQQAGGKLPNPCIGEILSSFPQVHFFLMYGQTEATARLSYLPPERLVDKLGSIGKGLNSTRLEVVRPDGTPVQPGSDEIGEIVAAGDNITRGYWNDPVESAKFFRDGRLYTGDIARVDSDGFIFIVEREREMIKSGGNRVSAKEVEDVIAEIPAIVEVAVVGLPHELLGECINAFIVVAPHASLTSQDVQSHCASRLPQFKVPEGVFIIDSMPHNGAGKVVKSKLREGVLLNAAAAKTI